MRGDGGRPSYSRRFEGGAKASPSASRTRALMENRGVDLVLKCRYGVRHRDEVCLTCCHGEHACRPHVRQLDESGGTGGVPKGRGHQAQVTKDGRPGETTEVLHLDDGDPDARVPHERLRRVRGEEAKDNDVTTVDDDVDGVMSTQNEGWHARHDNNGAGRCEEPLSVGREGQ